MSTTETLSIAQQFLLDLLIDGEPHSSEEIKTKSRITLGREITVHPRITDLREKGYIIIGRRIKGVYHFKLESKGDPPVKEPPFVQGYIFNCVQGDDPRNGNICKIVGRAPATDTDLLTYGPAFSVVFGDGEEDTAFSSELSPYYPT